MNQNDSPTPALIDAYCTWAAREMLRYSEEQSGREGSIRHVRVQEIVLRVEQ